MEALHIEGLRQSYGANVVIGGLDLEIAPGTLVSLLGSSGSGKTTLLRCIAGFTELQPGCGRIRLGRETLSGDGNFVPPERRGMAMVFQNYAIWPHMRVAENVGFALEMRGVARGERKKRVDEALEMVRLSLLGARYPHEISGGQRQRVALARALVSRPRLLLLDEPLSNLDAVLREDLGTEIRRLQRELGLTAILVTHDRVEALSLSDRVVVLDGGKIVADGTPEDLYRAPPTPFIAEFLAGGQRLGDEVRLPQRWKIAVRREDAGGSGGADAVPGVIAARVFRGGHYELLVKVDAYADAVKVRSALRLDEGSAVWLEYR